MEKLKSNLLAALGVTTVMLTIMLFSTRSGVTQSSPKPTFKKPFQVQLLINGASQSIPPDNIFVVENADIEFMPGSEIVGVTINTVSGGVNGFHCLDVAEPPGVGNISDRIYCRSLPVHYYIDGNSGIGASTEIKSDKAKITLSGYLTKSLP